MSNLLSSSLIRSWIMVVGVATLVLGAAYAMVQQSTRLSADDLPLTTAQVAKQELQNGSDPKDVVPTLKTNLRYDASVFMVITDSSQHVLASSATLDGQTPLPPQGVFNFTNVHGTDHFTWAPSKGVRAATRVTKYTNGTDEGYIVTGQSLKPYEDRISTYTWITLAAWLAVLAWTYLLILLPHTARRK
ncbi:MAG TPA: hypothetical protein VLF88_02710 [Candidatus Babeliales bacterium]|nr:hypothetical protein [Candidatus Babeliales bacterium]